VPARLSAVASGGFAARACPTFFVGRSVETGCRVSPVVWVLCARAALYTGERSRVRCSRAPPPRSVQLFGLPPNATTIPSHLRSVPPVPSHPPPPPAGPAHPPHPPTHPPTHPRTCPLAPSLRLCRGRRLLSSSTLPIRLGFDTSAVASASGITDTQRQLIINTVLPEAQALLQSLLSVDRVVGNLFASRRCLSAYPNGVCASYSQTLPTCGLTPGLTLPQTVVAASYHSCTNGNNVCSPRAGGRGCACTTVCCRCGCAATHCRSQPHTATHASVLWLQRVVRSCGHRTLCVRV
jgi:hypothetical protein